MLALIVRELIVAARRPAAPVASCLVGVLLTGFVVVWAPGIPVLTSLNLYEQARLLHWILLIVALPWTAVRSAAGERADDFVMLAALTGLRPLDLALGKCVAMATLLALVALTGLPGLVLAQQSAAVPFTVVLLDMLPLLGLAALISVSATISTLAVPGPLAPWLMSTASAALILFVLLVSATDLMTAGACAGLIAAVAVMGVQLWSHRRLLYLDEGHVR